VYRDKYFYMGEQDLCSAAFLLDTVQYYLFVVIPAYRRRGVFPWMPVLGPPPAFLSYHLMTAYSRRFKTLALLRHARGEAGRRNDGRHLKAYFNLRGAPYRMLGRGLWLWLAAEVDGLRLRVRRGPRGADGEAGGR
jgi:hypothetical protein